MVLDGNAQGGLIGNLQAGVGWVTGALVSPVTDDNFTMTMMMIAAMGVLGGALKGVTLGRLATTVLQRAGSVVLGGFGLSNLASWWNNPAQTTSDVKQGSGNLNAAFTMLAGALILFSPMLFKPNSKALGPVLDGTVVSGTTASQVVDDMIARMGPGTFSTQSGAWKVLQNNKVWLALQELKDGSLVILSSEGKMVRYVRSADDQWVLDGMESFTAASAQDIVANGGKVGFNPQATASGPEVASTSGTLATTGARPPPEGTGLREAGATVVAAKTIPKAERLGMVYDRVTGAPAATTAEEAMQQMHRTLDAVEDAYSGIPRAKNPGLDGRMYPAQTDRIITGADGTLTATSRGHVTTYGPNGSIKVIDRKTGSVVFQKPGGG